MQLDGSRTPSKELVCLRGPPAVARKRITGGGTVKLYTIMGPGNLLICEDYEGYMTGDGYAKRLETYIVGVTDMVMHDNLPAHKTDDVTNVLVAGHLRDLKQPALSPDLQPIENFFSIMKRKLYPRNKSYNSKEQLLKSINSTITKLQDSGEYNLLYNNLSLSMPNRLKKVIKSRGQKIKY